MFIDLPKTILLLNLKDTCLYLQNNYSSKNNIDILSDKIVIKHSLFENQHSIKIWKTKTLFNYWYDDNFSANKFIGIIDFTINKDNIKIDYFNINDTESYINDNFKLNDNDAKELTKSMIDFVKKIGKEEEKNKIIIDVHNNLRIFNKYYSNEGFIATPRKTYDHSLWIEAELNL